jgi:hypothetical protein
MLSMRVVAVLASGDLEAPRCIVRLDSGKAHAPFFVVDNGVFIHLVAVTAGDGGGGSSSGGGGGGSIACVRYTVHCVISIPSGNSVFIPGTVEIIIAAKAAHARSPAGTPTLALAVSSQGISAGKAPAALFTDMWSFSGMELRVSLKIM